MEAENIESILTKNAIEYYGEIIAHRAIPLNLDGLTDIQRRILYACYNKHWMSDKPHVKSARIIGEVVGVYHPHGDASAYESAAIMAQDWKNNITTIDFHGGVGSVSGAGPSAQRYTEFRTSKEAEILLLGEGLTNNGIDFGLNYSQDEKEPLYLPARLPMHLINGAFGIAAGYAESILPHNPKEVINEIINKLTDDNYKVTNLLPDLPTGGTIINKNELLECYNDMPKAVKNGSSRAIIRLNIDIDEKKNCLIITESMYMKGLNSIIDSIKSACTETENKLTKKKEEPKIKDITNIKDVTEKNVPKVIISVRRGADLNFIKNQLYKYTACQSTVCISTLAVNKQGNLIIYNNIDEIFKEFIDFRKTTIMRIKLNLIKKYRLRIHILEGLFKVLNNLKKITEMVQKAESKADIVSKLINDYGLTDIQADYIAERKLYQLSVKEIDKLRDELKSLQQKVDEELVYFKDKKALNQYMIDEFKDLLKVFNKYERKTSFDNITFSNSKEIDKSLIEDKDFVLIITAGGFIKKIELLKEQKKGTQGVSLGKIKPNDYVIKTITLNNRDSILIFTEQGKVYKYEVSQINTCNRDNLGVNINKDINNEKIVNMVPVKKEDFKNPTKYIMLATRFNLIKKVPLNNFINTRKNGIISIKFKFEDDIVINAELIDEKINKSIIALNSLGTAIRISIDEIPTVGREAFGSYLFNSEILETDVEIVSVTVTDESKPYYLFINNKGKGKLMNKEEFRLLKRKTKGMMAAKLEEDSVPIKLLSVSDDDSIIIVSNKKILSIALKGLTVVKRPTYGYKIKQLDEDENIIDVSVK